MVAAGDLCCPPLWISFDLRVSGLRFGTEVFVLWSASALYRICAIRDCNHVLVRWPKAWHSRGLDLVACPRPLLRTQSQRRISHSVWPGVPIFLTDHARGATGGGGPGGPPPAKNFGGGGQRLPEVGAFESYACSTPVSQPDCAVPRMAVFSTTYSPVAA